MHEFGIAQEILNKALEVSRDHGDLSIEKIRLRVGGLRLIVPEMLVFAFDALTPGTAAEGCALDCEQEPVRVQCKGCCASFSPNDVFWICPECGASGGLLMSGDDLVITSVVLKDEPRHSHPATN